MITSVFQLLFVKIYYGAFTDRYQIHRENVEVKIPGAPGTVTADPV